MRVNVGKVNEAELHAEWANGEPFNYTQALRSLLKTQDVQAWAKEAPDKFDAWLGNAMAGVMRDVHWAIVPAGKERAL